MSSKLKKKNNSDLYDLLKISHLFLGVEKESLERIIRSTKRYKLSQNEIINPNCCYLIEKGFVMVSRETKDGDKYTIDIINKGCFIGVRNLFNNVITNHFLTETVNDSILCQISNEALRETMDKVVAIKNNFISMSLNTNLFLEIQLEHRIKQNASQRIACFLLRCSEGESKRPINVAVTYKKQYLAAKLGVRKETFSRALQALDKSTGVKMEGSSFLIHDPDKLEKYTCHTCSLEYPCHVSDSHNRLY